MSDSRVTVGVLSLHVSKETKAILNAVDALGHDGVWLTESNTAISIDDGTVTFEPDVDVVVNRLLLSNTEHPIEKIGLARCYERYRPVLNKAEAVLTAIHKFAAATELAGAGLPVPDALLALEHDRLNREADRFGDELVYKTTIGTHGGGTWRVDSDDPLNPLVGRRLAFLQAFIDAPVERHRDVRVYVVDGAVVAAMYRTAPDDEWRTNVALGGTVADATDSISDEIRDIAVAATETLGLDFSGVDLIEGPDGPVILEVNPTAGFKGLFRATGISPAPKLAALAIERGGGTVDTADVETLSKTLDDSRPTGRPKPTGRFTESPVVAYIENVVVSGTTGSASVRAKSDTGASRTSIDTALAAEIGAGPIKRLTRVKSGSLKDGKARPVVDLVVGIRGDRHTVQANIEDRSHMTHAVLLGRDILQHYHVDVSQETNEE